MFCVLCRRLFWRDPKPAGRLTSRSRTRAVRRAAVKTRSSVRAMEEHGSEIRKKELANAEAVKTEERLRIIQGCDRFGSKETTGWCPSRRRIAWLR
jgi:hypothetical protein